MVLVDFWTYTCINCIRTLPYVRAWDARYRKAGLTIVGVHTPEFPFERDAGNVERAIAQNQLRYPVAQDNDYATWDAWGNQYWPAKYLVDARGRVRYAHFGEGDYDKTESAIRALLAEAGASQLGATARAQVETASPGLATPRPTSTPSAPRTSTRPCGPGSAATRRPELAPVHFALDGTWDVSGESATAVRGATHRRARDRAQGLPRAGHERRPAARRAGAARREADSRRRAGEDVSGGRLTVSQQRLYRLVALPEVEDRTLTMRARPGHQRVRLHVRLIGRPASLARLAHSWPRCASSARARRASPPARSCTRAASTSTASRTARDRRQLALRQRQRDVVGLPLAAHQHVAGR